MTLRLLGACFALLGLLSASQVQAQMQFPTKPITLIVPLSAGVVLDGLARIYADKMSKILGQPVVVSNRPGAGGLIGAQAAASAPADGYTIIFVNSGHAILGALNKNLPFDPVKDFAGVSMIGDAPIVVTVSPSVGVKTLADFVAAAKAKPGTFNYASAGIGTLTHIAGAYFARQAGIDMVHVPYKMGSDMLQDLIAGRVQAVFATAPFTSSLVNQGRLTALAVAQSEPMHAPIEVPGIRTANVDYQYSTWFGILAPARTPPAVLDVLSRAVDEANEDSELVGKIQAQGLIMRKTKREQFETYIREELDRMGPFLKDIGETMKQ